MQCRKNGNLETLWEAASKLLNFEKYYFNFIYTIPADKGIIFAVKATSTMPLTKIKDNLMVWFLIDKEKEVDCVVSNLQKSAPIQNNAFSLLIKNSSSKSFLSKIEAKNAKDILCKDIIDISINLKMKFKPQDLKNAKLLIASITNCLWHIHINEKTVKNASANGECSNLPDFFQQIYAKEYHQYKEQKLEKPQLSMERLRICSDELFDAISTWDRTNMLPHLFMNGERDLARSL